jgi:hypothetical protein
MTTALKAKPGSKKRLKNDGRKGDDQPLVALPDRNKRRPEMLTM